VWEKTMNHTEKIQSAEHQAAGQDKSKQEPVSAENRHYPGIETVIHGNGAVAYVMSHVCGGVIGYPITPSTEISEMFEAFRAKGGLNVWGKHPFFFEPEGEHSAQSGAMGAGLTGGRYISNASSSQGILYGLESHYVTVGKKVGGFVLQIAARSVSKHSLNVMAGHDDVYALLSSGYTVLFGSNPQEAADMAAIAYRASSLSMIPVANAMDGFATSHMQCEARLPEPELLREFLGDPEGRIKAPTLAQEMLYGAKGRVFQLQQYLNQHEGDISADGLSSLRQFLQQNADQVEADNQGRQIDETLAWLPESLQAQWRRQWLNAHEKGSRQRVPAMVDMNNPGLSGGVQNQPDFQAGLADHKTHFVNAVPGMVRQAMDEYGHLTGRYYQPLQCYKADDAEYLIVGLGSVSDDAEAVAKYLRNQGQKVGVVSVKLLQPFPEGELVAVLEGKKAVTVLERSEVTALTNLVTQSLFKARENADLIRHSGIPPISSLPKISTGIFGVGGHDLQPRHLIAVYENMRSSLNLPFFYLGSQFFENDPSPENAQLQERLKQAYPETEFMALETGPNPVLLPSDALRIRFHSVGGYGTIATGKLLTDILAGVLGLHTKSAPKYGSEKSGAPTNFYISLSPEPIKITNAELEDVEIVVSPDHKVFSHTNPLKGLVEGGTLILQSHHTHLEVWAELPANARNTIREKNIKLYIVDAFGVAKKHAPTPELEIRMMGIAFIGAVCGHVDRISAKQSEQEIMDRVEQQVSKKFAAKGQNVIDSNLRVVKDGSAATHKIDYSGAKFTAIEKLPPVQVGPGVEVSAKMARATACSASNGLFDQQYYNGMLADRIKDGSIGEAPVMPGTGLFIPVASAAWKDKGLFRLDVPLYDADLCTGCMECAVVCPDAAIPNSVHEIHDLLLGAIAKLETTEQHQSLMKQQAFTLSNSVHQAYRNLSGKEPGVLSDIVTASLAELKLDNKALQDDYSRMVDILAAFPVARTRPFFDAMEKKMAGTGGLYSVNIDPWKCTGCLECVDVCGPGALTAGKQTSKIQAEMAQRFEFLSTLPNTPARFTESAIEAGGDRKRLMLDHDNYYAMTGGHGACRGCGEVTAIRLLTATSRAIHEQQRKAHIKELEILIMQLGEKLAGLAPDDQDSGRLSRMQQTIDTLEKRLYLFESGPGGQGPAATMIANATGCSSVYASTFPSNPYKVPWVNSLFQDSPAVAKGIFEGTCASAVGDFTALRTARLDLADQYDPAHHDALFSCFNWHHFSAEEMALLPTVISMGGDGATYDIGFGALSRLLVSETPIKVVVLNTGAYSNTGGQTSTASFTAQDSDLTRFGVAHRGKHEDRKELGLIAAFHPRVLVIQSNAGLQSHFMKNMMDFLTYNESPAVFDSYTTCQPEHGIADDAGARHATLAVESRMSPVFVHDPRKGETLDERFSLEGNPQIGQDWVDKVLTYTDQNGKAQLLERTYTAADFAAQEGRFKKHFERIEEGVEAMLLHEYIDLDSLERHDKIPFIWSTSAQGELIRLTMTDAMVELTLERRRNWRMLEYLSGLHIERMERRHREELEALQQKYQAANEAREASIDSIARGMAELASASGAPGNIDIPVSVASVQAAPAGAQAVEGQAVTAGAPLVEILDQDRGKCTNCKTCYQDLSELFEKTTIVVEGEAREVSRVIPGALEQIELTPELIQRAARVADDCDVEIIHFHQPA